MREIWFEKWGWSHMPCHWKGWALLIGVAIGVTLAIILAQNAFAALGWTTASDNASLVIIPAILWADAFAKRHS